MRNIDKWLKELNLEKELVEMRRYFHKYPELSGKEYQTMDKICKHLDEWGIQYEKGVADTGAVATIKGALPGKTIGIRGDMDALPIQEKNTASYCSQNRGVMHACGHDAHTSILLGVAKVLKAMEGELKGNVKFFFQPAEETTGGAERMIQAGCLEDPYVDYVLGLHVEPKYKVGEVGIKYGKMYASSDMLTIKVYGKAAHGAHPEKAIDAIIVAANILNALQTVVSRNINPTNAAVCTFGTIHGGKVRNQIADYVQIEGIMRTLDLETRILVRERVRKICEKVADSMGARAELVIEESYLPLINTDEVVDVVCQNARCILGMKNVVIEESPDLGTEDFSYFAAERKSCYFRLGCTNKKNESVADLHNPAFDIDEGCLVIGVKLQVQNILSLLEK
ncbi:MAG: M20 family metallopeptidase [Anaerovorax sp.]|nr:M20 family metallopeptidase [Anaerovorax sp.]